MNHAEKKLHPQLKTLLTPDWLKLKKKKENEGCFSFVDIFGVAYFRLLVKTRTCFQYRYACVFTFSEFDVTS